MRQSSILWVALVLGAASTAGTARADQGFLGNAAGFNEFILNNATRVGDSTGQVAVGNNATFNNFTVGTGVNSANLTGPNALIVGGQLGGSQVVNNGAGNEMYKSLQSGTNVYNNGGGSSKLGTITNYFSSASTTLLADSKELAGQAANGTAALTSSGVLNLSATLAKGTATSTVYFNLTSAQLTSATGLNLNITDNNGTTPVVIVNVNGATDTFSKSYTSTFKGVAESNILYNFYNTADHVNFQPVAITLNSNPIYGSILTPMGSITANSYGQINGEVIAANFAGNIETHNVDPNTGQADLFTGNPTFAVVTASAVPEPAAILSTLSGLAMAAGFAWRRRRRAPVGR